MTCVWSIRIKKEKEGDFEATLSFFLLYFVFDVVFVPFRSIAGDHLADETGEEEHHTYDHGKDGEVEQRLVGDGSEMDALGLVDKFRDDHPDRHHEAYQEHQQAGEAEEMHRLLAECAKEPQ